VARAAGVLQRRLPGRAPGIGIVLGSGLGGLITVVGEAVHVPFADIPGFPDATVQGHAGAVVSGVLDGRDVLVFSGRSHLYEGHALSTAALPVRVMHALGVRTLLVSNAAGGIRRTFRAGDLMLIADQLNLTWRNPLAGPVLAGELRFPDMSAPYDPVLLAALREAARAAKTAAARPGRAAKNFT
jgi:purine-nucleoside phosphorylase